MTLYIILTVIIVVICLTCFKGKINKGIVVVVALACVISGAITSIVKTIEYCNSNNLVEWNDTIYIQLDSKKPDTWTCTKVFISDKQKNPVRAEVYHKTKIDVGLLWDMRKDIKLVETNLILNSKQYEVYKAYRNSLAQRKDSLESPTKPVWQNK